MNNKNFKSIIVNALREDACGNDITTSALINPDRYSRASIILKEDATICGQKIAQQVFLCLDKNVSYTPKTKDGKRARKGTVIASLYGRSRSLLIAERTALNFLGYLSGIATLTAQFVSKVKGYPAQIFDTRKTTPTLRLLEKYAVRSGGGENHRLDLADFVLIKDNHLAVLGSDLSIADAIKKIRSKTKKKIEIEVANLDQLKKALAAGPDIILLDNMGRHHIKQAVKLRQKALVRPKPLFEVSGNVTLENVLSIARSRVERISVGALTHSAPNIDFSLEITS